MDEIKVSTTAADGENWQLVLDNLHRGEIPPEDAKLHAKSAETEPVTAWIQDELRRAALALSAQKGEVVLRQLNRQEYENTIEDRVGVRGDYASGFPKDATRGGFTTNGAVLSLSAEQMSEYLRAADLILGRAITTTPLPEARRVSFMLLDLEARRMQRDDDTELERAMVQESQPRQSLTNKWMSKMVIPIVSDGCVLRC